MAHSEFSLLHAFAARAQDLQFEIETSRGTADFSSVQFRFGTVTKASLVPESSTVVSGIAVPLTLTAADLSVDSDDYRWELLATVDSEVRSLAHGLLFVGAEPTT